MRDKFLKYMEAFKPFLHAALKNTEEYTVCFLKSMRGMFGKARNYVILCVKGLYCGGGCRGRPLSGAQLQTPSVWRRHHGAAARKPIGSLTA